MHKGFLLHTSKYNGCLQEKHLSGHLSYDITSFLETFLFQRMIDKLWLRLGCLADMI